jgi:hypothetical protein
LRSSADAGTTSTSPQAPSALDQFYKVKENLIDACIASSPSKQKILDLARDVEDMGEQVGMGQASSLSGLLSGDWELLYASEDTTRSSPFFWAFRKAFPDKANQIFSITDAIPYPIKKIGSAIQTIELDKSANTGTLVSRVEVSTLGGYAKSTMTTRCTIMGVEGLDCVRVRVETTKPEKWTILQVLGSLGESVIENAPPFPSGEALEKVQPGSSEVVIKSTFCDQNLRISRDVLGGSDVYIWKRKGFFGDIEI